ncbi:2-oxoglutarate dehydrogenase E1 component [Blattabacterium cuenoti]|uniref:2-oxoglutarate dehydrogenase E1 component n=1 Tax=Blattabacterium cuenoti TaxID=1653831 RepID=UPI00163B8C15|nr:2-oxoglutarate dehydrogenase E1 component [Blattabacterium cuenoti]
MIDRYSFLNAINCKYIELLYEKYKKNPDLLESSWKHFFNGFDFVKDNYEKGNKNYLLFKEKKYFSVDDLNKEFMVLNLIQDYKISGHFFANTNSIFDNEYVKKTLPYYINLEKFGLSNNDLNKKFEAGKTIGLNNSSLKKIVDYLNNIYCNTIGIEYMHILNPKKIKWIEKWLQTKKFYLHKKEKIFFLKKLNNAVYFENFVHKKFVGQKRFSIEGVEVLLPVLEDIITYSSDNYNTKCFIFGMTHRGRLNILSNFFRKDISQIFNEFKGKEYNENEEEYSGDVKYHLGFSKVRNTSTGKKIEMHLVPNPSHLESVISIVEGLTRSKIDIYFSKNKKKEYNKIIPILIHGDAALSGQGIVYEVLQLSKLDGYKTGGTIHIVINNQIGFTTNPKDGRSSIYCTDIAKFMLSPILHVNAEDIESVIKTIRFAIDFRMRYKEDIFIDLIGYRKYGHNEGDEPRFTQPILYNKIIPKRINGYEIYKRKLEKEGIIDKENSVKIEKEYEYLLNIKYKNAKNIKYNIVYPFLELKEKNINFSIKSNKDNNLKKLDTSYPKEKILEISKKLFTLPKEKKFFRKTIDIFKKRLNMINEGLVDWSMAELLSYGTLLSEKYDIRLSGQDVSRGTFSQRHAIIKTEGEEEFVIFNKIEKGTNGKICILNSPLSEYGVLGFEYGYSIGSPFVLTLWEAQFGDFSNSAQIIIDQYITSAENKWKIKNGIVLLLPHGYEGQGPEHSSARIERYLQLCAKNNIFIANCTTPSNFYHLLRRQMKLKFRKPLVIFTPKSLFRNKKCISTIEELSTSYFKEVLDDHTIKFDEINKIKKIIFCSGKIYYDLLNKKELIKNDDTALIRIEQIYPLEIKNINKILSKYTKTKKIFWVQEEPENMGLWSYISKKLYKFISFNLISPPENSSPSTGSYENFLKIQNNILDQSFFQ